MRLTQKINTLSIFLLIVLFLIPFNGHCVPSEGIKNKDWIAYVPIFPIETSFQTEELKTNDVSGTTFKDKRSIDYAQTYKEIAFFYVDKNKPELACMYIEKYIQVTLDVTFVDHSYFDQIKDSDAHHVLVNKYLKKFDWWAIFCFYVAFVGFFLSIVLNLRKSTDKTANFLMSVFVLLHSCFIAHLGLYFMNYQFYLPHTLYLFSTFGLLYGPLIFFYFKRVTDDYKFKLRDLLHLLPTLLLIILLFPVYLLPADEKLRMVINYERPYLELLSISKLASLFIYGGLVVRLYFYSIKKNIYLSKTIYYWQRNVVVFCSVYILSYAIYATLNVLHLGSGLLFNMQVVSLAVMVLYVSYSAFVQPSIFGKLKTMVVHAEPKIESNKYEKSGLTTSLSLELKTQLIHLLNEEKIYKPNDITLQKLSQRLNTTRHNTSQVINEHFGLNFFELINKHRIEEAKELLKGEKHRNFNIIDVAYEVGFNNKVTFNKSFKKYNQITPSEYLKSEVA